MADKLNDKEIVMDKDEEEDAEVVEEKKEAGPRNK